MARIRVHWQISVAMGLLVGALVVGCQPTGRPALSTRLPLIGLGQKHAVPQGVILPGPSVVDPGQRHPHHILALSSGGLYGAYSVGFLAGWSKTGTRPEFDVVTGVSVGSLVAPYAFLGREFDDLAMNISTGVRAEDVYRMRFWLAIPFKDAVASSNPLRKLVRSQITQELLDRIAAEHRKGRRLYICTTNITTRRRVIWDMGAIASLPYPDGVDLFVDVLVASCSVPGMLPPVAFSVPGADGHVATELHVDGGVISPIFVPSSVFQAAERDLPGGRVVPGANGNVYAVVAGKLYPDARRVKRLVLPILIATTEGVTYGHCRSELGNLYGRAQMAGMRFHLTAVPQSLDLDLDTVLSIEPEAMSKLYYEGEQTGLSGPAWEYGSPELYDPPVEFIRPKHRWRR